MDEERPKEAWVFGLEPLPQTRAIAPILRRVAGLVLALEDDGDPAVHRLVTDLRAAEEALSGRVSSDPAPRVGEPPVAHGRPYIDHGRHIGAFNSAFPEYSIVVAGTHASGTVTFPVPFEGPPGVVHGGVLATFFDCVIQHHNCDVGVAGRTTSLWITYRRPAPVGVELTYSIEREADERRITSRAVLELEGDVVCRATMEAVAGDRSRLPAVAPRRAVP